MKTEERKIRLFVRFDPSLEPRDFPEQAKELQVLRSGTSQRGDFPANKLHKSDDNVYTVLENLEEVVAYNLFPLDGR